VLGHLGLRLLTQYQSDIIVTVPRKVRDLVRDLERAGFENRGGKGSHRNFTHPKARGPVTLSGKDGDDAKTYQERAVRKAIDESRS
jgi:predicted RNA binding protein YcfA (HicA-like mRNA interferase family)